MVKVKKKSDVMMEKKKEFSKLKKMEKDINEISKMKGVGKKME